MADEGRGRARVLRVGIITIGNEILDGRRRDTHRERLATEVAAAGGEVAFQLSIGDDVARIARALREGTRATSLLLVTGGLGATPDDVTREALARAFAMPLREDPRVRAAIAARFRAAGRALPRRAVRQADVPRGARLLPNPVGLAPGLLIERGARRVVALPGVASEFEAIVRDSVRSLLRRLAPRAGRAHAVLRTFGIGETDLAARLETIVTGEPDLTVGYLPDTDGVLVVLGLSGRGARARLARVARDARRRLGALVYATRDEPLEAVVLRALARRGERLAVAESFTGGLIAARLTAVPGASRVFIGGPIAYTTEEKRRALGVSERVVARHGVVSAETARAMAVGARRRTGADWAVATTGVAGPARLEGHRPGTAFGAVAGPGSALTAAWRLWGGREDVRRRGATAALDLLRLAIREGGR